MKSFVSLLDGGMGRELKIRLSTFDPVLWSASAFVENPEIVKDVHEDFIHAGASIITTNNYAVVPSILKKAQRFDDFESFTKMAGQLAVEAVKNTQTNTLIAGSLPPLHSTYRPDLIVADHEAMPIYHSMISWLDSYVDLFLCESVSSLKEAHQVLKVASQFSKPVWISFILNDEDPVTLLSGDSIFDLVSLLNQYSVEALLFNCCHPASISNALSVLDVSIQKGGYANKFTALPKGWDHLKGELRGFNQALTPAVYADYVQQWIAVGATVVGGCCGIGPDYISYLSSSMLPNV